MSMVTGDQIRDARIAKGWSQADLAKRVGVSQVTIQQIESGKITRSKFLPDIERELGINPDGNTARPVKPIERYAPVVGRIAAGVWLEHESAEDFGGVMVPHIPGVFPRLEQQAFEVIGKSMDLLGINHGDYVVCVPYFMARREPTDGDIVVVERTRDGGDIERSIKEVQVSHDRVALVPRSSDPRYQEPLFVSLGPAGVDGYEAIQIVGLVVGLVRRFGR